jgi:hypothetical protein
MKKPEGRAFEKNEPRCREPSPTGSSAMFCGVIMIVLQVHCLSVHG